jgi:hypothetical protein
VRPSARRGRSSSVFRGGDAKQFAFSWLFAFLFFLSLALGALFFVLIHFATQAGWGSSSVAWPRTRWPPLPLFALLFVPVLLGMGELFPWVHPHGGEHDHVLAGKAPYLNVSFFVLRAAIYFTCWAAIAVFYVRRSRRQDVSGDHAISVLLRRLSGPAIIVLALTQTFAAVDWIMSLDPYWYSDDVRRLLVRGLVRQLLRASDAHGGRLRRGAAGRRESLEHFHDLGKMLFAFTVFWAYIGFSQFFLIWYGNIPEETIFFRERLHGSWSAVSFLLAAGHFVIPFFFFMPRTIKRNPGSWPGAGMLLMHAVDVTG